MISYTALREGASLLWDLATVPYSITMDVIFR